MSRDHVVRVRLSDQELASLDAAAAQAGSTRARVIRELICAGKADAGSVPSRREALAMLAAKARSGHVVALVALERALRTEEPASPMPIKTGPVSLEELRAELRVVR